MRFSQNSTEGNAAELASLCNSQSTSGSQYFVPFQQMVHPLYHYYFNQYYQQFIQLSQTLTHQLVKNSSLISCHSQGGLEQEVSKKLASQDNSSPKNKNATQNVYERLLHQRVQRHKKKKTIAKNKKYQISSEQDSYRPDFDDSFEEDQSLRSESKNMPKNYGKAIINFIQTKDIYRARVLAKLKIEQNQFQICLDSLKGKLNTISQLRSLWLDSQNQFAQAFRIFTSQYLRKYSLSYIFNSRVQNYSIHIKYRYKIIQSVSHPDSFTCMKQF